MEKAQNAEGTKPPRPKACVGALYFSQHRYDRELSPVCMGFRKRKANDDNAIDVSIPTDSVPGGDFKYMCIGYSAWDDEALRDAARNRRDSNDPVQLPYCEGLEVVSAAAINNSPELLSNGPQVGQQDGGTSSEAGQEDVVPGKKGRSFVPDLLGSSTSDNAGSMDLEKFFERFRRVSYRITAKMYENAEYVAETYKRQWKRMMAALTEAKDRTERR